VGTARSRPATINEILTRHSSTKAVSSTSSVMGAHKKLNTKLEAEKKTETASLYSCLYKFAIVSIHGSPLAVVSRCARISIQTRRAAQHIIIRPLRVHKRNQ